MTTAFASAQMGKWQETGVRVGVNILDDFQSRSAVNEALLSVSGYTRYCVSQFMIGKTAEIPESAMNEIANAVSAIIG